MLAAHQDKKVGVRVLIDIVDQDDDILQCVSVTNVLARRNHGKGVPEAVVSSQINGLL